VLAGGTRSEIAFESIGPTLEVEMRSRLSPLLVPLLLSTVGLPAESGAQRLSLAPEIGFYIPTEKLVEAANGTVGELEAGPSFGLRLGLSLGRRVGVSLGGSYVPTTFAFQPGGGTPVSRDARLFNGTGQLTVFLLPPGSLLSVFLNGGVGVVSRGGVAFTDDSETSDVSGVFGGGIALKLGGMGVTAGADLFTYTAQYTGSTQTASELRQLDVQLRLGLDLLGGAWGGRQ
jgi:hypothetical protein